MTAEALINVLKTFPPTTKVHIGGPGGPVKKVVKAEVLPPSGKPKPIAVLTGV